MSRALRRKERLSDPGPPLSPLPPPTQAPKGLWRYALPLLLLLYVGLAGAHLTLAPTGQTGYQNAPDEAAHVAYVRAVAHGRLPTRASAQNDPQGYEWHQPPLYYGLAAPLLSFGPRAVRLASILCGLAGLGLIYRAGRLLFPDNPQTALLATGIAALTPAHVAITSTVNNDALLEVCCSFALLTLFASLRGGFTTARAGWLGLALGAAILTKATGVLLLPFILIALVLLRRGGEPLPNLLRGLGWTLTVAFALCGWWLARNFHLYGEPLPLQAFRASFGGTVQAADVASGRVPGLDVGGWGGYYALAALWTFQSFWAVYGTPRSALIGAPRFLPAQFYGLLAAFVAAGLAGLTRLHFRRKTDFTEAQRTAITLLFGWLALIGVAFVLFLRQYFQTQGRYLYPAMLPICLLLALGWQAVIPPRYASLANGLLLALLFTLSLAFLNYVAP